MRTKDKIHYDLVNTDNWKDLDRSRKAFQNDILIEVLCDIRDILKDLMKAFLIYGEDKVRKD